MPHFSTNLFSNSEIEPEPNAFWDSEPLLFANEPTSTESILNALTFRVSRKPRNLLSHLRRIYFCYQNALSEQLYAAILDFLIVLNGKGRKISLRLIQGSHSQLDHTQMSIFKHAVTYPLDAPGNRYSLFTKGVLGTFRLMEVSQRGQELRDYLALADDFIEFSQLDEAMSILELGLDEQPERQDLQAALLELYKSTESRERFNQKYEEIKAMSAPLIDDWQRLADFFDGKPL